MKLMIRVIICLMVFFIGSSPVGASQEYFEIADLIHAEQFSEVEQRLSALDSSRKKNEDGIYIINRVLWQLGKNLALSPDFSLNALNQWCDQHPDSPWPFLVRGRFYKEYAWDARGTGFADTVSVSDREIFKERQKLAEQDLRRATELSPQSAEPWIALMTVYLGTGEKEKMIDSFNKALGADSKHLISYKVMLNRKMAKWGGSDAEMWEFAKHTCLEHKEDPAFAFLLLIAHDEAAAQHGQKTGERKRDYYKIEDNYKDMRRIVDGILQVFPDSVKAKNWSAQIDYYAGKYPQAFEQMDRLGDSIDTDPWSENFFYKVRNWLKSQKIKGKF